MLDKSIPYKNVIMKIQAGDILAVHVPTLPDGFSFRFYENGDEAYWARIETSVGEFDSEQDALDYFVREFMPHLDEMKRRCVFVVNPEGLPVATTTAWFAEDESGRHALLHWVSVCPDYQGSGLGRAVVSKAMSLFPACEPFLDAYLHTQTWSHVAIGLYRRLGFYMVKQGDCQGIETHRNDYNEAIQVLKGVVSAELLQDLMNTAKQKERIEMGCNIGVIINTITRF